MDTERQREIDEKYMYMCEQIAQLSRATRAKVGALIARDGVIISTGFNGTPRGTSNECEQNNVTVPTLIHAEVNAILNMVISGNGASLNGATIYVLYSPCPQCAAIIKQVGICRVVYRHEYRLTEGIDFLRTYGVEVVRMP